MPFPDSVNCKYKRDSAKWRTLTDSVTRYIAKEMQPLNTVEKPAFKNMLQTFFILKNKMFFVFERVHLHYYAIILSYCNYIISEIKFLKWQYRLSQLILVQYIAQQKVVIATALFTLI